MKHFENLLLTFFLLISSLVYSQTNNSSPENIKLFVGFTDNSNLDLSETTKSKLRAKIIQLVNRTGVAEVGYSNFLLYPEFYLNETSVTESGLIKLTVVNCELNLFIARILPGRSKIATGVYSSFNKKLSGTGSNKEAAINNAIDSFRSDDKYMEEFLIKSKISITEYFNKNCQEVILEAERLYNLERYDESISLYFSIPANAPCYDVARNKSIAVYKAYLNNQCKSDLIELKSTLAMANNSSDENANQKYDLALNIFKGINPTTVCYEEAMKLIQKTEDRFDKRQKEEWDLNVKVQTASLDNQKEMYKAMGKVATNYQPSANNIVFV